ncbi:NTP transferase domain-containing protein [Pseudomonas anuradhapurensis]|uniref:phosphocholine cytidylyltransferase family protein n=1 Tax=Pseudomonas TaxID=286 RepID=UPI0016473C09|nr:NTP transferase domain-containing protein [Pseudomonas anuradhapurensis]QXI45889.1 NTP transferase domain-containing protein [Pseudomonas anuradhapurensis]
MSKETPVSVIILAAGLGSRLEDQTLAKNKCLVEVAGKTIISRLLEQLQAHQVSNVIVGVGYLSDVLESYIRSNHPQLNSIFVTNPIYARSGSVHSLSLCLEAVPEGHDVVVFEGDVVVEDALVTRALASLQGLDEEAFATVLAPWSSELSGTFALVEGGRVSAWKHESVRDAGFPLQASYKTVNITAMTHAGAGLLQRHIRQTVAEKGVKAPLEYAMDSLIDSGYRIDALLVGQEKWFEVDTAEDLDIANDLFSAAALAHA